MKLTPGALEGIWLIEPEVHEDARGFFMECWNEEVLQQAGVSAHFVQHNHSRSHRGVLRGLHFQNPQPQGKLVRVTHGAIFDVVVDLRRSSPSFGQWAGYEISARNRHLLWVPEGFAHGFLALEPDTDLTYSCTARYAPQHEHCLAWNDPALAIEWPLDGLTSIISPKDSKGLALDEVRAFA